LRLSKYELHLLGFQLPEAVPVYQREYDLGSAPMLGEMADAIEDKPMKVRFTPDVVSSAFLERVLQVCSAPESRRFSAVSVDSFTHSLFCSVKSTCSRLVWPKRSRRDFRLGRTDRLVDKSELAGH
jgi:hypothetical protein